MKKIFTILFCFTSVLFSQVPTITTFTPTSGPIGTTVTITGTNFSTTAANNIVWFGGVKANVTTATATQLQVTVPLGANNPIKVLVNNLMAIAQKDFIVTLAGSGGISQSSLAAKLDFATGSGPYGIAINDLDMDGKPDLVVTNQSSNPISIYRNTSTSGTITSSSFATKIDFTAGSYTQVIAINDLDMDGKPDIVVTNWGSHTISIFRNTSTSGTISQSSFATKVDFATGINPRGIAINDLDMDGKPDLVVTNANSNTVSVFRNTITIGSISSSSFATKVDFATGTNPRGMAINDLDMDGKPDLVVTNYNSKTISIYRNTSTSGVISSSSFASKVDFTTGTGPQDIELNDLDIDGKPDIVVTNANSNTVSVFRNTITIGSISSSSFATKVDFATGTGPWSIAINDLDMDGKPELVVTNVSSNTISIYRNTSISGAISTSSFANKVDFATGTYQEDIAINDLDMDGKPDLVITNYNSNTISIYKNRIFSSLSIFPQSNSTKITLPLTFKWKKDPTAVNYNLKVSTSENLSSPVVSQIINHPETTYTTTNLLKNRLYYWQVNSENFSTTSELYFGKFTTQIDSPQLSQPANNSVDNILKPIFSWQKYYSSARSIFQLSTDSIFTTIIKTIDTSDVSFTSDSLLRSTSYYWRVKSYIEGDTTNWSKVFNFRTIQNLPQAPVLVYPVDFATNVFKNVFLKWNKVAGATSYTLQISTSPQFSTFFENRSGISDTIYSSLSYFADNTTYYWKVNSQNSGGVGNFTTPFRFTVGTQINAPTITSFTPTTSGAGATVTLTGTNFTNATAVTIGGTAATSFTVVSATSITAVVGSGTTGTIAITTPGGTATSSGTFTFISPPTITSFTPTSGEIGTTVAITGTNFSTTATNNLVWFGGVKANVTSSTATQLEVTIPLGANNPIKVLINNLMAIAQKDFIVTGSGGDISATSLATKVDFATGTYPSGMAINDLDMDGKPDLIVPNYNSNTISIYRNTSTSGVLSSSSFASKIDFATGTNPYGIAINDLDMDGKPDLVVTNRNSNTISVFRNTTTSGTITTSSFITKVDFTTGTTPTGIAINDLDMDGKPDLVVTNYNSNTISIYRNTSTSGVLSSSSFGTKVDFTTGTLPWGIAIKDLDMNGKPDIVVTNNVYNTISIYRNISSSGAITTSSFANKVDFATGSYPRSIAINDLNMDGKPDLVVTNESSNTISIFRNTSISGAISSSSFASKVDFATGTGPRGIAINDLDMDGKPELVVTNVSSNTISIYRNTSISGAISTSSFANKVDFATRSNPYGIAINDLDMDGKPDLAVTNIDPSTISVFRNVGKKHKLEASKFGNGTITPLGDTLVTPGDSLQYKINAFTGYHIFRIIVDSVFIIDNRNINDTIYTFRNIDRSHSINVIFRGTPKIKLNVSKIDFGSVKQHLAKDTLLQIKNEGNDTLKIKLSSSSTLFTIMNPTIQSMVEPNMLITEPITFRPNPLMLGSAMGKLYIESNHLNQPTKDSIELVANVITKIAYGIDVPKVFSINQNYPNPFNPATTIRFGLPKESFVTLEIYNSLGQLVQTLINEKLEARYYEAKWEAGKIPTGLYFYKITAVDINDPQNKFIETKKMMLVK